MKCSNEKSKPIHLGVIKQDKVHGITVDMVYNLDKTLAIFMRDTLIAFSEKAISYPFQYEYYDDEDAALEAYKNDLRSIANKLDFYIKDDLSIIAEEKHCPIDKVEITSDDLHSVSIRKSVELAKAFDALKDVFFSLWL